MFYPLLFCISVSLLPSRNAENIAHTNENKTHSQLITRHYRLPFGFYSNNIYHLMTPRCICSMGYLSLPRNKACSLPFRRGPCPPGHYVDFVNHKTVALCLENPCFEDGLVLYNGTCHKIGLWGEGPCNFGGLVTDPKTFQLKCIGEVAIPLDVATQLSCSDNRFLNTFNSQDSSTWKCQNSEHGRVYFPLRNQCHKPYRQGPCQAGSYLYPGTNETEPKCVVNSCVEDGLIPYNGSCYTLEMWEEGPCDIGGLLIDPLTLQFKCFNEHTTLEIFSRTFHCPSAMSPQTIWEDQISWTCRCKQRNHLYVPSYKNCYGVYERGPCPQGQYVYLAVNDTVPQCVVNPCLEDNMVLYNRSCHKIGVWGEGPCNVGGLIIDQETFQPKCIEEMTKPLLAADHIKCSHGRILNTFSSQDLSIWKCECENPGYFYFPSLNACYKLYRQGPCPRGQYVYIAINETEPQCVVNPCSKDGLVPYKGKCYKYALWEEGPCNIGGLVADPTTFQLKCIDEISNLSQIGLIMQCPHRMVLRRTRSDDPKTWHCECPSYNQLFFPYYKSCVKVYNQGPCPPGYYVYRAINEAVPYCAVNPCHKDGMVPYYNGTCYELGWSEGVCPVGTILQFRTLTFQLECVVPMREYSLLWVPKFECPFGTQRDRNNLCRALVD